MNKGACIIGQSGGPTAVINSSVLGIIEKSLKENAFSAVYGALNGINGIIEEEIIDFSDYSLEELQLLKTTYMYSLPLEPPSHCLHSIPPL